MIGLVGVRLFILKTLRMILFCVVSSLLISEEDGEIASIP